MGLSAFYSSNAVSEEDGIAVIQRANELGITHIVSRTQPDHMHAKACSSRLTGSAVQDTSDIYQSTPGGHENEHLVGETG